jgi:hypothetical protein
MQPYASKRMDYLSTLFESYGRRLMRFFWRDQGRPPLSHPTEIRLALRFCYCITPLPDSRKAAGAGRVCGLSCGQSLRARRTGGRLGARGRSPGVVHLDYSEK